MNWDDLRILISVRDEKSYARAGAALNINETTIARRLARLETKLGYRLFDAVDGVRQPTRAGLAVLNHAQQIAAQTTAIETINEEGQPATQCIRIAMTQSICDDILAPKLAEFLTANPKLSIQFLISGRNVDFSRWEADIAIRLKRPEKGDFLISKLADISLFCFEPTNSNSANNRPLLCRYPQELDGTPEADFIDENYQNQDVRFIVENSSAIRALIKTHQSIGVLPLYSCEELLMDKQLRSTQLATKRSAWLLVQSHLKHDSATRKVTKWVQTIFNKATI